MQQTNQIENDDNEYDDYSDDNLNWALEYEY